MDSTVITDPSAYTIIRVKRKLTEPHSPTSSDDRFTSFKRLRHIGSFSATSSSASGSKTQNGSGLPQPPLDEKALAEGPLLKQMGFSERKRVRISDIGSEQFALFALAIDGPKKKIRDDGDCATAAKPDATSKKDPLPDDLVKINLTAEDFETSEDNGKKISTEAVTCNGAVLEVVPTSSSTPDQYIYDYYVLLDNYLDFEEVKPEEVVDDQADDDENDENYRYNDYPDEDEFGTETETDGSHSSDSEYGYRDVDEDGEGPEYYDDEDEDFCGDFDRKLRLARLRSGGDGSSSSDGESFNG